jgi:hypothetical protein
MPRFLKTARYHPAGSAEGSRNKKPRAREATKKIATARATTELPDLKISLDSLEVLRRTKASLVKLGHHRPGDRARAAGAKTKGGLTVAN